MGSIGQELSERSGLEMRGATPAPPYPSRRTTGLQGNAYAELKQLIKQKGLLDRQPAYYTFQILLTLGLLALSATFLVLLDTLWMQLLNAVFLAFCFQRVAFFGHDSAHRQIAGSISKNNFIALVSWSLLLGVSKSWWMGRHNRHHAHPNQLNVDPDVELWFLCFSEEAARQKRGYGKLLVRFQTFLVPLLSLYPFVLRFFTFKYLLWPKGGEVGKVPAPQRYLLVEMTLIAAHFLLYFGLSFYLMGMWPAVLFIAVHQGLWGLYFASVTASNHKGMPILEEGADSDFLLQQVLTSRNVRSNPLTDFWYGGLNYQIEHHLFPNLPRNKLGEAQVIVRSFCQERSISYCDTSLIQSWREILGSLQEITLSLRKT